MTDVPFDAVEDRQTCQGSRPNADVQRRFQGSPLSRPENTIAFAPDFGARWRAG